MVEEAESRDEGHERFTPSRNHWPICKEVSPQKNNILLSTTLERARMRTQTQLVSSQLSSLILSIEKSKMLHYTRDGNARAINDLPLVSLRMCERVTNLSGKMP